jgi:hypothetical protein
MEEKFKKFLDRSQLPDDMEALKDMIVTIANLCLETFEDYSKQIQVSAENNEYLQSQIAVLKRFQFGQRSERLKKKRLQLLTTTV